MTAIRSENPLVSVIIPAYNAEETIEVTISSVLKQTLNNIEIIVIDDGSTDKTGQIIDGLIKLYPEKLVGIHIDNSGVSAARNIGIDLSHGKYIGFVDADDTISPNMYEEMSSYAEEKHADMVQCWRYDVFGESRIVRKPHDNCTGKNIYDNPAIVMNNTMFVWDKIFRRKVIIDNNVRFKSFRYAEDYLFVFQYEMFANGIEEIKSPLYNYKAKRNGSVTSSYSDALLDCVKVFDYLNNMLIERGEFSTFKKYLWEVEANYYIRRINDFQLYTNKLRQEEVVNSFFTLFDKYFFGWKEEIKRTGTKYEFEAWNNAFRSDLKKMHQYIYSPRVCKISRRLLLEKSVHFFMQLENYSYRVKNKVPLMKYAKYRKRPLKENAVLLTSYFGSSFSDSMYYMAKDFLERGDFEVYIGTNSLKRDWEVITFNGMKPILIDVNSEDYLRILATAKYLVCNSRFPSWFFKRPNQIYLNTWHGTPLKKLGKDMNHGLRDVGNNQSQFLMCDYLLYPNEYTRDCMMNSFFLKDLYVGKVVLCGYPRNTIFFDKEDATKIRAKMGLNDVRVYIYMPTWRGENIDNATVSSYARDLSGILAKLDQLLDDSVVIYVKLHQVVMRKIKLDRYKHIRKPHPLYENYRFANISDGLITDYSSVFFDYANSGKEIILFTYDYDEYMKERGTYFDIKSLPFKRIDTVELLAQHLNSQHTYIIDDKYTDFCQKYCLYDSANSAKYLNDLLLYGKRSEMLKVENYSANNQKSYNLILMSSLASFEEQFRFKELVLQAHENDLFVFSQQDFEYETERMLVRYANSGIRYVIIPGDMPESFTGFLILSIYRRFKLMKKCAKSIYKKDMERVLPGIKISSITNYSEFPKFQEISSLF